MPWLQSLASAHGAVPLSHSFPAVTWPSQATMLTGALPREHGIVSNGVFDRAQGQVEMWTSGNEIIQRPQIWDRLGAAGRGLSSAVWFPMLSKRCTADLVCMPAPVHHPDGSESLWCYSKPDSLYGELLERLGHFPLQHFWGPLAGIASTQWILDSAAMVADKYHPDYFYIYVPHLDYSAQKFGPDSPQALAAAQTLDSSLGGFAQHVDRAYSGKVAWMIASEYVIVPTDHVTYPNRMLRERGWLNVRSTDDGEWLDIPGSAAFALVDHQFSHVYLREPSRRNLDSIAAAFASQEGITHVLDRQGQREFGIDHERSGDLVVISSPHSWQAYYYWLDDQRAPSFARTVDIHRKPGYDPIELHFDMATRSIPLEASLNRGSHGVVGPEVDSESLLILPPEIDVSDRGLRDIDVSGLVLKHFGMLA
jgi:predicted AlkP superfamily pyrophosphatase or phosphodiesterase